VRDVAYTERRDVCDDGITGVLGSFNGANSSNKDYSDKFGHEAISLQRVLNQLRSKLGYTVSLSKTGDQYVPAGYGGFSSVHLVEGGGKRMALKLWSNDAVMRLGMERLENIGKVHAKCAGISNSQYRLPIPAVISDGTAQGVVAPHMLMEYAPGRTLKQEIKHQRNGDAAPLIYRVMDVSRTTHAMHAAQVVHGDMKPQNLVAAEDATWIVDFDLARDYSKGFGSLQYDPDAPLICTPGAIAPEVFYDHIILPESDQYGLGLVLYEVATGVTPFKGMKQDAAIQAKNSSVKVKHKLLPGYPRAVKSVIRKACDRNPNKRFDTAGDFADALAEIVRKLSN
jgi:serine/threonine protein kinase